MYEKLSQDNGQNFSNQLDLLIISDIHGRLISVYDPAVGSFTVGLDCFSTYVKRLRENGHNVFVINNGDSIQGSPIVDLHDFHAENKDCRSHPVNVVQNHLGVDCFIPGNHEFNFGIDFLTQVNEGSNATWLSANIYNTRSGALNFTPYHIQQCGNIKIGVIGVTTDFVTKWESKKTIANLEFRNAVDACKTYIPIVKSKCDFLIVAYHGGLKFNPANGDVWSIGESTENQGIDIWDCSDDIDLLITGHQHRQLIYDAEQKDRSVVVQASCFSKHWAHIKLQMNHSVTTEKHVSIDLNPGIVSAASEQPDSEITLLLKQHLIENERILSTHIGSVDSSFSINNPMADVWLKKHPLIQWINQLMCECAGVSISAIPLLNPELKGLSGDVTIKDILTFFFFQDSICIIEITGSILKKALEKSAGFFQLISDKNGEKNIGINPDWHTARVLSYNYDMWEGFEYGFALQNPIGNRLIYLKRNGVDITDEEKLQVAVTSHRSGGAFYDMFSPELIVKEIPHKITDLMIMDLREKKHLSITPKQNFKILY